MANLVLQALRPTPTGAALLAVILYTLRNQLDRQLSWSKALVILLLFLNRGSFPLRWHLKLFWIALRANLRYRIAALGFRKPNPEQKKLGIKGGDLALGGVGRNYMDIVSTRNTRVSFAESDYNLYVSFLWRGYQRTDVFSIYTAISAIATMLKPGITPVCSSLRTTLVSHIRKMASLRSWEVRICISARLIA